jgi:hypothetical protein
MLQFLKSRSNTKVTTSNDLYHYKCNTTKNDYKPWRGLVTRNAKEILCMVSLIFVGINFRESGKIHCFMNANSDFFFRFYFKAGKKMSTGEIRARFEIIQF